MTRLQQHSRKRRRESDTSWPESDTIAVIPRPNVPEEHLNTRAPLKETHTRANVGNSRHIASHDEVHVTPTRRLQPDSSRGPSPAPELSIPDECCYRCRIRGGRAAYCCQYKDGQESCTRCISENRGRCRMATEDELRTIAARCSRCTIRGFKNCNGGNPCDVCIKHNTQNRCAQLPQKVTTPQAISSTKPTPARPTEPSTSLRLREQSTSVRRSGRKRRKVVADVEEHHEDEAVSHIAVTDGVPMDIEGEHDSWENRTTNQDMRVGPCDLGSNVSDQEMTLHDDHNNNALGQCDGGRDAMEDSRDDASSGSLGHTAHDAAEASPTDRATSTDATTVNDDDDFEAQQQLIRESDPKQGARPRRSLGRVSYVEVFAHELSDHELDSRHELTEDDDSDAYVSNASVESEIDQDSVLGESVDESSTMDDGSGVDEDEDEGEEPISVGADTRASKSAKKSSTRRDGSTPKAGKGIDFSLPPLGNIEDIFADMASKAVELGLTDVIKKLNGRHINVATMCSGTESPLLALEMLSKALENAGLPSIKVNHHFSAEIEVVKQGYIERNFAPSKLFRDVRDFIRENSTTAVTAYGAEESIPACLDILIAGFVCKDLSRLNTRQKDLDSDGESGDTWRAIYSYAERFRPSIVLLENVKSTSSLWDKVVSKWAEIDYEAAWLICDTKRYYVPQTRERMYMIAIERSQFGKNADKAVEQWRDLMLKLQRQCSSPYEAFLKNMLHESSDHSALVSEPDWALCKLRYDHIRSDERLGILRPVTRWSENGTVRPPDFANRAWYDSQSSRVYDAIDVAHLQAAQKGYDSLYKMAVWDVSQNVDRFKADLGILPCITPGGCDFASNRQQALTGSQLLLLQGMPLNKLIFANETQKDCQDLAGNAMSTTVIGASLISALISGWRSFRSRYPSKPETLATIGGNDADIFRPSSMKEVNAAIGELHKLNIEELKQDAYLSARLCNCEGDLSVSKSSIQVCSACKHTSCARCAGNPKHEYSQEIPREQRRQTPSEFRQKWKTKLPTRFAFETFPDVRRLFSPFKLQDEVAMAFTDQLVQTRVESQYFYFQSFIRENCGWKITYSSNEARLELRIGRDTEWLLFVDCDPRLAGNSPIRKIFEGPVARAEIGDSLLEVDWKLSVPRAASYRLQVHGSASRVSSWRSRLGLPAHKNETVPMTMQVRSEAKECDALVGDYVAHPDCGTASHSLYKRSNGRSVYLFLDPNLIGKSEDDGFVFSQDCGRKHYDDTRMSLARVDASWRPWLVKDCSSYDLNVVMPGFWLPAAMKLKSANVALSTSTPTNSKAFAKVQGDCSRAILVLDARAPERLPTNDFKDYSWALQHAKCLPSFSAWQPFSATSTVGCSCAPAYPRILWHVDKKGIATPHEDRKVAASFERAIKTRPPVFQIQAESKAEETHIQIAINVSALIHRAKGRIEPEGSVETTWRLISDHTELSPDPFPAFRLLSNRHDALALLSPAPSYLTNTQPTSLSWMQNQELGRAITITEVEEAVDLDLGWRAEAQAHASVLIRGGVLADLPSFGKTVTTIALIQSEFEQHAPDALLRKNQQFRAVLPGRIDTPATLIVCPPHIALQWQTELKKFLGAARYEAYNVLLIESFSQLQDLSINAVRESRVIIVSWSVFAEEEYISHLAHFTTMPEPSLTGRRAFHTWLSRSLEEVPSQLEALRGTDYYKFKSLTKDRLEERLQHEDFQVTLPLKIQHGSAYESFTAMRRTSGSSKVKLKGKVQAKTHKSSPDVRAEPVPLLHLFQFNRVVIDEYHYLNDDKQMSNIIASVSAKQLLAHKRWVLSGTPALGSFSDVNQIASYLGVTLGRFHPGDGTATTRADKGHRAEQTLVEDFLNQTETMSRQWHRARHERAQEFLDLFVRQNEACLGHIICTENILPVELDIGHHAVYLELSQHLISQKMQIKKLNNKLSSDKIDRLNSSLNNSATAEDALLKSALFFESARGQSGLDRLRRKRSEQRSSVKLDLSDLMAGFEGLSKTDEISELYTRFKEDIKKFNWLGDKHASETARKMLVEAEQHPIQSAFPQLQQKKLSVDKRNKIAKKLLSDVRETARELALRTRSERFIAAIQELLQPSSDDTLARTMKCSSPQCTGAVSCSQLHLVSHCGHTACENCLLSRANADACVHPECNVSVQEINLIKVTELGATAENVSEHSYGQKMEAITHLISTFPKGDQGLVFAPNDETVAILENVFDQSQITYHSPRGCKSATTAKVIEDFKTDNDPETQSKILILNLGSESAAGVNLVNANHIIFVSPLLAKTQYEYDSAMAQAIARSRRYGQEKKVHVYHVIAQRTIDVDILELRHKRVDGITTLKSLIKMPAPLAKKENTRLVRNKAGDMVLVPASWLTDASKRKILKLEDTPSSFTSLISFSDTFRHDDE